MMRNVLRWYLFSCYTSLRYGDLYKLEQGHIRQNNGQYPGKFEYYIDKTAEKNSGHTPKRLMIPLVENAILLLP